MKRWATSALLASASSWVLGLGVLGLGACAPTDELPPGFEAFPNRREPLPLGKTTLGFVNNVRSDTVSVVDLDSFTLVRSIPVGRDPVERDGPRPVVLDPAQDRLFVAVSYPESSSGPHSDSYGEERPGFVQILALSDLRPLAEHRVAWNPFSIALSPDRAQLAVSHYDTITPTLETDPEKVRAKLYRFGVDEAGLEDERVFASCVAPTDIIYDRKAPLLYVVCQGDDFLATIDTTSGEVLSRVDIDAASYQKLFGLALDSQGKVLAVTSQLSRSVALLSRGETPALQALVSLQILEGIPAYPTFSDSQGLLVAIQDKDGAARIDPTTGENELAVTYAREACHRPSAFEVLPDGRVFLVCEGSHYEPGRLVEINPETLEAERSLELELYPEKMAVLLP